ncbi:hypothetical protein FOZ62_021123, partial [Perkinsus olseni]
IPRRCRVHLLYTRLSADDDADDNDDVDDDMREGLPQKSRIGLMLRISLVLSVGVVIGAGVYVAVWSIITPRLAMLDSHEEVIQKITRSIEGLLDEGRLSTDYERDEGI